MNFLLNTGTRSPPVRIPLLSLSGNHFQNVDRAGKEPIVVETQLRLAANVLTSGICSEDGLEDATTLLLQLSKIDKDTRDTILSLLLDGARDIAYILCSEIKRLLLELKEYNAVHFHDKQDRDSAKVSPTFLYYSSIPLSKILKETESLCKMEDIQSFEILAESVFSDPFSLIFVDDSTCCFCPFSHL